MLKIFKFRKNRKKDIRYWVFHAHTYHVTIPSPGFFIRASIVGIMILGFVFLLTLASVGKWGKLLCAMMLFILFMWLIISMESMEEWVVKPIKWRIVRKYWPLLMIPLLALTAVVVLIDIYPDPEGILHRSDILGFCGDYLAFLGTFCLGYFIYAQDRVSETEKRNEKIKLLYELIQTANRELFRLTQLAADEEYLKIPENRERIKLITYNPNWSEYCYEYEALRGASFGLYQAVERFFDTIIQVNEVMTGTGQIEAAAKIYERYQNREAYSLAEYHLSDVLSDLRFLCKYQYLLSVESWTERRHNVAMINNLCKKYYYVIENYIYTWLLKHHVNSTVDDENLRREVVDWLLEKSPGLKKYLERKNGKRLLSHVVYDCSLKFKDKSARVNYERRVYFLK